MLCFLNALLVAATVSATPIGHQDRPKFVPGKYVVQLRSDIDAASVALHRKAVNRLARRSTTEDPIERTFNIGKLNAYLGNFDEQAASDISSFDEVLSVVPDEYIYLEKTDFPPLAPRDLVKESPSLWSLGDLSHKRAGAKSYIFDSSAGEGMTVYVFDSGIRVSHEEFGGRARFGINAMINSTDPSGANKDTVGHGTHCAGTVAGKTFGVAKKASVVDVKVFEGEAATMAAVLTGMQWAIKDVQSRSATATSVFSMSLVATTPSKLIDDAIKAAYELGILTVVAAGNENGPISPDTPARVPEAFTVGMTDAKRNRAIIHDVYGSNYGPEMDVFAPGRDIWSASNSNDTGYRMMTGTSMAAPFVAGLVCYLRGLEAGLETPDQVTKRILDLAIKGAVKGTKGSPNLLVNNGSGL